MTSATIYDTLLLHVDLPVDPAAYHRHELALRRHRSRVWSSVDWRRWRPSSRGAAEAGVTRAA